MPSSVFPQPGRTADQCRPPLGQPAAGDLVEAGDPGGRLCQLREMVARLRDQGHSFGTENGGGRGQPAPTVSQYARREHLSTSRFPAAVDQVWINLLDTLRHRSANMYAQC